MTDHLSEDKYISSQKLFFESTHARFGDCHLDADPVHYMDLIDSEERFLQKAVGKKHNFSNCECFFLSQPGFSIYYWKAI